MIFLDLRSRRNAVGIDGVVGVKEIVCLIRKAALDQEILADCLDDTALTRTLSSTDLGLIPLVDSFRQTGRIK